MLVGMLASPRPSAPRSSALRRSALRRSALRPSALRPSALRPSAPCASALAAILLAAACSPGSVGPVRDGGAEADAAAVDAGPSTRCDDDGDCAGGLFCSGAGVCIPVGSCRGSADCAVGETCGAASRECLASGTCAAVGDCPEGRSCALETGTCEIGGGCGGSEFATTRLPPNVLIVLDRSGSMDNDVGGRTRWDVAKDAIRTVTTTFDADIRFGLATYSSCLPGGCSAGSVVVPIADANATAINDFLAPLRGEGSSNGSAPRYLCDSGDPETSTGRTLFAFVGEPTLQDPARSNAVLLVTDGAESGSCTMGGAQDGPAGAGALYDQAVPVRTYVVGFSSDVDAGELNAVATAGGTTSYYAAGDAAALTGALDAIAADVRTCDFLLGEAPADLEQLYVYFNDDPAGIDNDPANGWTYDAATMTLTFHGTSCDQILAGTVDDIDVVFGCMGPVLE